MKKLLLAILLVALLSGCSAVPKTPATVPSEVPTIPETLRQPRIILPLPEILDLNTFTDGILSVSLEEGDAYVDDTGIMRMHLTVYRYDLYDMVDIGQMEVGDTILLTGQPVEITQLERRENGSILINGGLDLGGWELVTDEDTVYYQTGYSDVKAWQKAGEITLPVSPDFQYTDLSDLDGHPVIRYPGDFLIPEGGIDYFFIPQNTTVIVENGMIIAMERIYVP